MLFQVNFYKENNIDKNTGVTVLQVFYSTLEKQQVSEQAKYEVMWRYRHVNVTKYGHMEDIIALVFVQYLYAKLTLLLQYFELS